MQVIILLFEQYISNGQQDKGQCQINPMPGHQRQPGSRGKNRAKVDEAQRYYKLHKHINAAHQRMRHLQLIGHQLVRMLAVRLAQVLVQQDAMAYGKASIHAIDQQEDEICHVARSENERAYEEEQDICYSD